VKKTESRAIETDPIIFATPSVSRHIKTDNIHNTVVNGCDLTLDSLPSTSQSSHNFGALPSADAISEEPQEIEGGEKKQDEPYPTFIFSARSGYEKPDDSQKVNSGK
jgi:hypothetical protein